MQHGGASGGIQFHWRKVVRSLSLSLSLNVLSLSLPSHRFALPCARGFHTEDGRPQSPNDSDFAIAINVPTARVA